MCGRMNVTGPYVPTLLERLGTPIIPPQHRLNLAPGAYAQFVVEQDGNRQTIDGMWSMLIERKPSGEGFRPDPRYHTFNARSDALTIKPTWRKRYRTQRAIVPVSGFHEWKNGQCYQVEQEGQAIALAGLYEVWDFDGEVVPAFSVITLPPHPRFAHIHDKSIPLMLEPQDFDLWLDPSFTQVEAFGDLMQSRIRHPLCVTPIASPATLEVTGPTERIEAD